MLCTKDTSKECLPDIIECENLVEWNMYLNKLYDEIFKPQFIDTTPTFKGWSVLSRREPKDGNWEHGFTHMTHVDLLHSSDDPNERIPDFRRSERLNWVRPVMDILVRRSRQSGVARATNPDFESHRLLLILLVLDLNHILLA